MIAVSLTKICNDLRWMGSGPNTGLGELHIPDLQPGSSIMPGKVNPSMLECMNQVCFHIIGSATAIDYAVQAGQLELNVMMPLMAFEQACEARFVARACVPDLHGGAPNTAGPAGKRAAKFTQRE